MNRVAEFGRFSRMYTLLAGLVAATVVLSLVVMFTDPKPAEAYEETWYGTFEQSHKATQTFENGHVFTVNDYVRWTAPNDMNNASVDVKIYQHWAYPPYTVRGPGSCYLSEKRLQGTYTTIGSASFYYHNNYWEVSPTLAAKPVLETRKYAGSPECAGTETAMNAYAYPAAASNFLVRTAVGAGTTCPEQMSDGIAPLPSDVRGCMYGTEYINVNSEAENLSEDSARWSLARDQCSGYTKSWNIGKSDRLFLFNNCQTRSLSARTSWLDDVTGKPKVCSYTYSKVPDVSDWSKSKVRRVLNMTKKAAMKLNKACSAYKAVRAVEWSINDWFMYNAANNGACGVWVVDDARWRPPKIKSATRASDGQGIAWISPGRTEMVKTATGSVRVTCPG